VRFERTQVIIHLLPRQPHPRGERGGRCRHGQFGQQPAPDRIKRGDGGSGIVDHVDIQHGRKLPLTNVFVNNARQGLKLWHCC
jgi:hypothetical protein